MGRAAGRQWAATTSAEGTSSLSVPGNRTLSLAVEGPAGGKLAPCAASFPAPFGVRAGQTREVAIYLAPATAKLVGKATKHDITVPYGPAGKATRF